MIERREPRRRLYGGLGKKGPEVRKGVSQQHSLAGTTSRLSGPPPPPAWTLIQIFVSMEKVWSVGLVASAGTFALLPTDVCEKVGWYRYFAIVVPCGRQNLSRLSDYYVRNCNIFMAMSYPNLDAHLQQYHPRTELAQGPTSRPPATATPRLYLGGQLARRRLRLHPAQSAIGPCPVFKNHSGQPANALKCAAAPHWRSTEKKTRQCLHCRP